MFELIIFIILGVFVLNRKSRLNNTPSHTPPVIRNVMPQKPVLSPKEITKQVNKQIYGTEQPMERTTVYNRLILTDRYQNIEKIAHELGISKYQALREIKKLKEEGHYLQVEIDEHNYRLIYPSSRRASSADISAPKTSSPKKPVPPKEAPRRIPVNPSKPCHPSVNSGEHYEDWMRVPPGKIVVHCSYCGADNLIFEKQEVHSCTCYFCREEL